MGQVIRAEHRVGLDTLLTGLGQGDGQAALVARVAGAAEEAAPFEVLDEHRRGALGQGQVSREGGQPNAAVIGGDVVEQLELVLGEVSGVGAVERQPQAAVSSFKSF